MMVESASIVTLMGPTMPGQTVAGRHQLPESGQAFPIPTGARYYQEGGWGYPRPAQKSEDVQNPGEVIRRDVVDREEGGSFGVLSH